MCQYLLSRPIKSIKSNKWLQVMITCLHIFKFPSVSKFSFRQNKRSEVAVAVNLLSSVVFGMPKKVIGVQGVPGNQLTK